MRKRSMGWLIVAMACTIGFAANGTVSLASELASESRPVPAPAPPPEPAPQTIEELTAALSAFRVERLSAADRRAVLSLGDDLMLVAPGDELPGIGWNRVLSVQPDRVRVAVSDSRTALLVVLPDGTQRVDWLDGRAQLSPPMQQPVILPWTSEPDDPEVKVRRFVDLDPRVDRSGNPPEDSP